MSLDSYITEYKRELSQEGNSNKIVKYSKIRKELRRWYELFGFVYPHTSENNFRDGWFHYRKLYQEHSTLEVTSQVATLDEHLQRAEKDSVVFFFQKVCELMEFWYYIAIKKKNYRIDSFLVKDSIELFDSSLKDPNSWVILLKDGCECDILKFSASCIYIGQNRFLNDGFIINAQKLLHEVKDDILKVRIGGAQIARLNEPGDYYKAFEKHFENLLQFVNKYRIFELLSATDIIETVAEESFQ